jgi:hypothetical protein
MLGYPSITVTDRTLHLGIKFKLENGLNAKACYLRNGALDHIVQACDERDLLRRSSNSYIAIEVRIENETIHLIYAPFASATQLIEVLQIDLQRALLEVFCAVYHGAAYHWKEQNCKTLINAVKRKMNPNLVALVTPGG